MIRKLLAVGFLTMLAACITNVDKQFETDFPVGKVVQDKVTMTQGDVVLPPGEWTVLATTIGSNNNRHSFGQMALGRIDEQGYLRGFVTISSPLNVPLGYSFYASDFCEEQMTALYRNVEANIDLGNQRCFDIRKKTISSFSNFDEFVKVASSNLRAKNVDRPYDMISATFRITRRNKYLRVEYGFDYREDASEMLPGYETGEAIELPRPFFPEEKTENVKAVIRWAKSNIDRIKTEFLD